MFRPHGLPAVARLAIRSTIPRPRIDVGISVARRLQSTAELPKTTIVPPPPPSPKKTSGWMRLFRYTYRLVYISSLGGVLYFGYSNPPYAFCVC